MPKLAASFSRLAVPLALAAVLAAVPAALGADKADGAPMYSSSTDGFDHFIQDQLGALVAGKTWEWDGHVYESIRLHRILKNQRIMERQAGRDYAAGLRGWTVAVVHVKVDGQLRSGKVTINTSYAWDPSTWVFDEALLYLGRADSFDFVAGKIR